MTLFQKKYRVESAHLKDYDYASEGDYYVTIDVLDFKSILGRVEDKRIILSELGAAVENAWKGLPERFKNITLGDFIIMPNHMHGIIRIRKKTNKTLHDMVRAFKSISAIAINKIRNTPGTKIWQSKYYDSIINGEIKYFFITEYILNNPLVYEDGKGTKEWYELFEERNNQKK
jgi:REP element-mobilizing transposase RayT